MKDAPALVLLAVSVLAGGLRAPELAAAGAAAAAGLALRAAPLPLGPAARLLPWLAWALVSAAASAQPLAGPAVVARWAAFGVFLALASRWDAAARELWLRLLLGLGAVLAAAALATGRGRGFGHAMSGLLPPYYNYTAFVLAGAAAAAAAWALSPEAPKGVKRAGLWALAAALAACLILARSRGGLLGLGAAGLWLAWRAKGPKAALGLAAACALALLAAPRGPRDALLKLGRPFGEARPAIWAAAAALASERPLLGQGPGNFGAAFRRVQPAEVSGGAARWGLWTPFAHSEPAQAAAETGWAGLALWLLALGSAFAAALRGGGLDAPQAAARAALIAFLPQLLIDNMLQLTGLSLLTASALGVARPEAERGGPELPRAGALALAAFSLAALLPHAWSRPAPDWYEQHERLAAARRAARLYPADSDRREDLAWILEISGDPAATAAEWEAAERLAPRNAVYPWRLGRLEEAAGRPAEAAAAYARALEDEPGFLTARADRAAALAAAGRLAEARAELLELRARAARPPGVVMSGYDRTISSLDSEALARAEAALGRLKKRK